MKELRYTMTLLATAFIFSLILTNCKTTDLDGWNQKEIDWVVDNVE